MSLEQRIEDELRRRPSDERIYSEPLGVIAADGPGTPVRLTRVRPRRAVHGAMPVLAALCLVAVVGAGLLLAGSSRTAPAASADPRGATTIDLSGPTPEGMMPLGAVQGDLPGSTECSYRGIDAYEPIAPAIYNAVSGAGFREANLSGPAMAAILDYRWSRYAATLAGDSGVTIPDVARAFRPIAARMRLLIDTPGNCYDAWTVTARSTLGYDGAQDDGGWTLLGDGRDYADQAVVSGLPDGDWMIHVHLEYDKGGTANWTDSYARVIVGGRISVPAVVVPAPEPAANCSGQAFASDSPAPVMSLTAVGAADSAPVTVTARPDEGKVGRGPTTMPAQVVTMREGSVFTIRTADGSCGNHLNGVSFFAIPADLLPPYGPTSELPFNDGSKQHLGEYPTDSVTSIAPARGQWVIGVAFMFGGPNAVQYFWRVSVVAAGAEPSPSAPAPSATTTDVPTSGAPSPTPTRPPVPTAIPTFHPYTVKAGDFLSGIAIRFNVRLCEIVAVNPGIAPDHIEPGQVINIPVPGTVSCDAPASPSAGGK